MDPWRLATVGCYARVLPCLRETMERRMACISEVLGERRREGMRGRVAEWRVFITLRNGWLADSESATKLMIGFGWEADIEADLAALAD